MGTIDDLKARYHRALHAMQAGVALKMNHDGADTTPKHLRVGVNAAMSDQSAVAILLVSKGVITETELWTALCESMEREKAMYEAEINARTGGKVTLV
jgi:fructose/tagatose bisphosphate aldolase